MMQGNEKDCICHKPKGKHTRRCDAYRLSEFFKKCGSINAGYEIIWCKKCLQEQEAQ